MTRYPTVDMAARGHVFTAEDAIPEKTAGGLQVYGFCATCHRRVPLYRIRTGPETLGHLVMLPHGETGIPTHAGRGWKYTTMKGP